MKELIKNLPFYKELSDSQTIYLKNHSRTVQLNSRQLLYQEGDSADYVYLIIYGGIKLFNTINNKKVIFDLLVRGDLCGYLHLLNNKKVYEFSAVALEQTLVLAIQIKAYEKLKQENPKIASIEWDYLRDFIFDLAENHRNSDKNTSIRLARLLLNIYKKQKNPSPIIPIKLSKQDLSDRIRAKSETVIRCFSAWEKSGLLTSKGRTVEILQIDQLEKIANSEEAI